MRRNLIGEGILSSVTYTPAILCYLLDSIGRLSAFSWLFAGLAASSSLATITVNTAC